VKLLFSEATPDYPHYLFPYAIWALPEKGDTASDLFNAGFLPASRQLDRYYMCRQVRVNLSSFEPSSENRRILRKGGIVATEVLPRKEFRYTARRRAAFLEYADRKFGKGVMTAQRLNSLFSSRLVSHLMVFTDTTTNQPVGTVTLFLEEPATVFYYYAFYDLKHPIRNLGMFMMTSAAAHFAAAGFQHLYLGSVYSRNAFYKTQFKGAEFFNGFRWSGNLKELKYLLHRDASPADHHLLESSDYLAAFYDGNLSRLGKTHGIKISR